MEQKKNESIGALWENEGKNGTKYLSGNVEIDGKKHPIVVFKNTYKQPGEKSPDWRILPKQQKQGVAVAPDSPAAESGKTSADFDDNIPFNEDLF